MNFEMKCRIDDIENHEGSFFHIVTTPAPDAYTKPSSFKVRSKNQLGHVGQEVTLAVQVSGNVYTKTYKKDGVNRVFKEANVYLEGSLAQLKPQVKSA